VRARDRPAGRVPDLHIVRRALFRFETKVTGTAMANRESRLPAVACKGMVYHPVRRADLSVISKPLKKIGNFKSIV
jgi:hypothetical protein